MDVNLVIIDKVKVMIIFVHKEQINGYHHLKITVIMD